MIYQDIPGWFPPSHAITLGKLIEEHKISQVIEIGSYLGRSTGFFASKVLEVCAIDPFVMWEEGSRNGDAVRDGGDDFYQKFLDNMKALANTKRICRVRVARLTSEEAFNRNPEMEADLIYVDGAHDYESVKKDLTMWGTRARKVICGDDYDENWPGVMQAVDEIFPDRIIIGNIWIKII